MKVITTGSSGYLGTILTKKLIEENSIESVTGIDLKAPSVAHNKFKFFRCDIREKKLFELLTNADVAVHFAFIVQEIRNKKLIYDINVNGTRNFFNACEKNMVKKIVVASSIAAYGSVKRNCIITEETPLEGNSSSYYSHTKKIVEDMLDEFERRNPDVIVTRLRPSILIGKNINNPLRKIVNAPVLYHIKGNDTIPVVYEEDVADAFCRVIVNDHPGVFNIHGGELPLKLIAQTLGIKTKPVPFTLGKMIINIAYLLGITSFSGHWVELSRYPFILSNKKAREELGWIPSKTPNEAFMEMLKYVKGDLK